MCKGTPIWLLSYDKRLVAKTFEITQINNNFVYHEHINIDKYYQKKNIGMLYMNNANKTIHIFWAQPRESILKYILEAWTQNRTDPFVHVSIVIWQNRTDPFVHVSIIIWQKGRSWTWSYDNKIYNYLCNYSAYSKPLSWRVYSMQHYVIKLVPDLRLVGRFLRFLPSIKLTATI